MKPFNQIIILRENNIYENKKSYFHIRPWWDVVVHTKLWNFGN